ncbi:hypothetical protein J1605_005235 [Eschrichtius robustus]|uniref:TLC domain-containing protein n=1 Tax=Eschrichtius robustus TaxID=9764 RepID=A0AB34HAC5_ESCRO|nr:hypothetical protein J1605_005235 [Eschrichtius robustus]
MPVSSPSQDFGVMFLHHLVSIFLITFSYVNNMARVGTLVLCLHDSADALLEAAKMANYAKFQKICDLLFVMFAMVFITTRLGIFPLCFQPIDFGIPSNTLQVPPDYSCVPT